MPLINGKAVKFAANPPDIPQTDKVFQIRFTGEIFKTYEEYSARLDYYRQPKFSCKYTGKSGFNYENAIDHENQIKKEISTQFPQEYLPLIFKEIQYSQLKLTELTNKIYEKCLSEFKIKNNIKDEPEPQSTKITAFLQPQQPQQPQPQPPQLESIQTANTSTNNNEKQQQKQPKKPKKKTFKHPFKKHLIRTQIRVAANQQHFKNAPWILHHDIATKYDINIEMPQSLKIIIDEYIKKQNEKNKPKQPKKKKEKKVKTKKEKQPKAKKEKKEKIKEEKPPKPESLIASLCIKSEANTSNTKSLKYPCDDQLLLMYDKMDNEKLIAYDTFWNKIQKIGSNQIQNVNENENDTNNYSNLAFLDYNTIYDHDHDEDMDIDIDADLNRNALKHRQLNDLFNEIWKLWSFIECYHIELDITPFPISFLMDSLCYDKRCILLDELQVSLLEIIRKHCITTIAERIQERKEEEIKKIKARKKQQKANKRKAERKAAKAAKSRKPKKSDKEEADDDEDEEDEESSEDEEMSDSESEEESSEEETESDSEDEDIDIDYEIAEPQWDENSLFTDEPLGFFKLDLLREYLRFRCSSKEDKKEEIKDDKDEEQEIMDIDEKDEEIEEEDIDMNTEDLMNDELEDEEQEPLLPEYEYVLSDEIWDKLNNIRSYVTLPIESKLEILKILFQDVMSTNVMNEIMTERIEKYPDYKQTSKELDDEYNIMVKEEKLKLREIRSELIIKKRILNPKRSKSKKTAKAPTAGSSSSSPSASATTSLAPAGSGSASGSNSNSSGSSSGSKSNSNSPNKENNGSRANSRSDSGDAALKEQATAQPTGPRITSRQQIMLAKKEQKERELREREEAFMKEREHKQQQAAKRKEQQEKEALKQEIQTMSDNVKIATNLMNERIKQKQEETMKKKYELSLECRTYLNELGTDRFNNRYFWSNYSDGRIFIYHSNDVYHNTKNKDKDCLITKEILKINENEMRCSNEWEMMTGTDDNGNQFCWSFVSTTTKFYQLLNVLDSRGLRENELLLMLNSLKSDIVASMKMIGNDDYKEVVSMDLDGNDVDDNHNHNRSQSETSSNTDDAPLRRSNRRKSTRTRNKSTRSTNNGYRIINVEPPFKQFANKGFLSYKNMVKRR